MVRAMSQQSGLRFQGFQAMVAAAIVVAQLGMAGAQVAAPTCTGTTITCNLPAFTSGTFVVLDASDVAETDASCIASPGTSTLVITVSSTTCYYTRVIDGSNIKDTVKLAHVEAAAGTIISGSDLNNQPTTTDLLCSCTSPVSATAETNFLASTQAPTSEDVSAAGSFTVTAAMYLANTYTTELAAGGSIPSTTARLYMEFASSSTADIIGVDTCSASPAASASSSPYEVSFLASGAGCAAPSAGAGVADLSVAMETESDNHKVRISVINFKFAGTSSLYIWCTITRCVTAANTCGSCPSARRLDGASAQNQTDVTPVRRLRAGTQVTTETVVAAPRALQATSTQAQIFFATQPGGQGDILPGDISDPNNVDVTVLWEQDTPTDGAWTNFTLYGSPSDVSTTFLEGLAQAFSRQMGPVLMKDVYVRRILGLHRTAQRRLFSTDGAETETETETETERQTEAARRLSSESLEALIAECVVRVEYSGVAQAQANTHANTTRETLSRELLTNGGWSSTNLFVVPSEFIFRGAVDEDSNTGSANTTTTLAIAIAAAACGALGCACALFLVQLYIRRRDQCRVIVISQEGPKQKEKGAKGKHHEGAWLAPLPAF